MHVVQFFFPKGIDSESSKLQLPPQRQRVPSSVYDKATLIPLSLHTDFCTRPCLSVGKYSNLYPIINLGDQPVLCVHFAALFLFRTAQFSFV